jgi:CheY-like chemotaxis protein
MKRKYTFLWIDDNPDRKRSAKTLEKSMSKHVRLVEFLSVSKKNISVILDELLLATRFKYDLILIDHFLNDVSRESIKTGSSAAEYIREKKPNCPIIGVTAANMEVDLYKKSMYEALYAIANLSSQYSSVLSIAESYRLLNKKRPENNETLIELIKPSAEDKARLVTIIPDDIRRNYKDDYLLFNVSKWIRHTLMAKPGFLYDRLWVATLLGLKEESFKKVAHYFEAAKYSGLFSDEGCERWWQTKIRQIIYSRYPKDVSSFPWQLGQKLPKIAKRDYSLCHVCGKGWPETVGYTDAAARTPVQLHLRCSIAHPGFESSLYFEDIRMMKPAE